MGDLGSVLGVSMADLGEVSSLAAGAIAGGIAAGYLSDTIGTALPQWSKALISLGLGTLFAGFGLRGRVGSMAFGRYGSRLLIGSGIGMALKGIGQASAEIDSRFQMNTKGFLHLSGLAADDTMLLGDPNQDIYQRYLGAAPTMVESVNGLSPAPTTVENVAGLGAAPMSVENGDVSVTNSGGFNPQQFMSQGMNGFSSLAGSFN